VKVLAPPTSPSQRTPPSGFSAVRENLPPHADIHIPGQNGNLKEFSSAMAGCATGETRPQSRLPATTH